MDSSSPLSFSSEPADIRNLFSSYTYESPNLNSVDDFKGWRDSEDTDFKEEDSSGTLVSVECVENNDLTNKDIQSSSLLSLCSEPPDIKNLFPSYVYESPALDSIIDFRDSVYNDINDSEENDIVNTTEQREHISDSPGAARSELGLIPDVLVEHFKSAKDDKHDGFSGGTNKTSYTRRLVTRNQMINEHSAKLPNGDNEKDNYENGFISTRKHKRNSSPTSICPSHFPLTREADLTASKGNADGRRRVLSETTNVQQSTVSGTTGKWKCPQKTKPNVGPPLKQLRLEKWVHRQQFPS